MSSLHNQPIVEDIISAFETTQNQSWALFNNKLGSIPIKKFKKKDIFKSENPIELSDEDIPVFGLVPRLEKLMLVSCNKCSMIVKRDCIHHHYNRRHNNPENDNFSLERFILPTVKTNKHKKQKITTIRKFSEKKIITCGDIDPVVQGIKTEFDQLEFERLTEINRAKIKQENEMDYADECDVNPEIKNCRSNTNCVWNLTPCTQRIVNLTDHKVNDRIGLNKSSPNDGEELQSNTFLDVIKNEKIDDYVISSHKFLAKSLNPINKARPKILIDFTGILNDNEKYYKTNNGHKNKYHNLPSRLHNNKEQTKFSKSNIHSDRDSDVINENYNQCIDVATSCNQLPVIPIGTEEEIKFTPCKYLNIKKECSKDTTTVIDHSSDIPVGFKEETKYKPNNRYLNVMKYEDSNDKIESHLTKMNDNSQFVFYQLTPGLPYNKDQTQCTSGDYIKVTNNTSSSESIASKQLSTILLNIKEEYQPLTESLNIKEKYQLPIASSNIKEEYQPLTESLNIKEEYQTPTTILNIKEEYQLPIASTNIKEEYQPLTESLNIKEEYQPIITSLNIKEEYKTSTTILNIKDEYQIPTTILNSKEKNQTYTTKLNIKDKYQTPISILNIKEEHQTSTTKLNIKNVYQIPTTILNIKEEPQTSNTELDIKEEYQMSTILNIKEEHPTSNTELNIKEESQIPTTSLHIKEYLTPTESLNIKKECLSSAALRIKEEINITPNSRYLNVVNNESNDSFKEEYNQLSSYESFNKEQIQFKNNKYLDATSSSDSSDSSYFPLPTNYQSKIKTFLRSNDSSSNSDEDIDESTNSSIIGFYRSIFKVQNIKSRSKLTPRNKFFKVICNKYLDNSVATNNNSSCLLINGKEKTKISYSDDTAVMSNESSDNASIDSSDQSSIVSLDIIEKEKSSLKIHRSKTDDNNDYSSDSSISEYYQLATGYHENKALIPLSPSYTQLDISSGEEEIDEINDNCEANYVRLSSEIEYSKEKTKFISINEYLDNLNDRSSNDTSSSYESSKDSLISNVSDVMADNIGIVNDLKNESSNQLTSKSLDSKAHTINTQYSNLNTNENVNNTPVTSYDQSPVSSIDLAPETRSTPNESSNSDSMISDDTSNDDQVSTVSKEAVEKTQFTQTNVFLNYMNHKQCIDPVTEIDESIVESVSVMNDKIKHMEANVLNECMDCHKTTIDLVDCYYPANSDNIAVKNCIHSYKPNNSSAQIKNNTTIPASVNECNSIDSDNCKQCILSRSHYLSSSQRFPWNPDSQNDISYHRFENKDKIYVSESYTDKPKQNENVLYRNTINGLSTCIDKHHIITKDHLKKNCDDKIVYSKNCSTIPYVYDNIEVKVKKNLKRRLGGQVADDKENHVKINKLITGAFKKLKRLEFATRKITCSEESDHKDNVGE